MIQENISLKQFNTFGIDVRARFFARFADTDQLLAAIDNNPAQKLTIIGGGSNILFTKDYEGLVLKNEIKGIEVVNEDLDSVYVKVGAGENWHRYVLHAIDQGWGGVENLSLIPGNVGAGPMQNIGAYGQEIKETFFELEALEIGTKRISTFSLNDCAFGYRESIFKNRLKDQFVILTVTFCLSKFPVLNLSYGAILEELQKMGSNTPDLRSVSQAVINIRQSKLPDPAIMGNAGSYFKNPVVDHAFFQRLHEQFPGLPAYPEKDNGVKLAAGWLIEQCGWRGYRKADAGCYEKQALVLVNYGKATGTDIVELGEQIYQSVKLKFGIELEREVNIL